jgi:hypothetical protein
LDRENHQDLVGTDLNFQLDHKIAMIAAVPNNCEVRDEAAGTIMESRDFPAMIRATHR